MVTILSVGVLNIQGAVSEHVDAFSTLFKKIPGTVCTVKQKKDIDSIDALVIPGGESTTISRVLTKIGLYEPLQERIENDDIALLGTCAGCILLAKQLTDPDGDVHTLQAMEMAVERNAFGRQKESFEQQIIFNGWKQPYPAVFIRAPSITKVWGSCQPLATLENHIIAAQQGRFLALSFHPELTKDLRIHQYFVSVLK